MKTTIEINGVTITLSEDQLKEIDRQRNTITHYTQIKSYEDACKVLNKTPKSKEDFEDLTDWLSHKLKNITKAVNSLIIIDDIFPDFSNQSQKKWYNFLIKEASGWVIGSITYYYCHYAFGSFGYNKTKESCEYIGKTFLQDRIDYIESLKD